MTYKTIKLSILAAVSMTVTSCGGSSTSPPPPPTPIAANAAPQVSAGADQSVAANAETSLTATAIDPDGDSLQYMWSQTAGTTVTLTDPASLTARFTSPSINGGDVLMFEFKATDSQGASAADSLQVTIAPPLSSSGCEVTSVPDALRDAPYNLDVFYQKYCDADGLPVLGSLAISGEALQAAEERVVGMLSNLFTPVADAIVNLNTRIAIMAQSEVTTDIPEHSDLYQAFPGTDWDVRARGLGATPDRPTSSGAEENLLCLANDNYIGEDIFIHEFAHTIHIMGLKVADANFDRSLTEAYNNAISQGLWENTYAATNAEEYWAEGVQTWFNVNQEPQMGIHNDIDTRAELRDYDFTLYELIDAYMPSDYQPACPE